MKKSKPATRRSTSLLGHPLRLPRLGSLYESWKVPFAVLFSLPAGVFGAALFAYLLSQQNNIYFQIGILAVIGLAAKNAILIIEYAKVRVDERGMDPVSAAIEAAKIRLRPIIMTSLPSSSAPFRWPWPPVPVPPRVSTWGSLSYSVRPLRPSSVSSSFL